MIILGGALVVEVKGKSLILTHSCLHVLLVNIWRKEGSNDHNEHVILGGALVVEAKITHTLGVAYCLTE